MSTDPADPGPRAAPGAAAVGVTWWGHASVTVTIGGLRVLTDPVLTSRLAHLARVGSADPVPDARRADAVLVSHLHADHLHLPSLKTVDAGAELVLPAGAGTLVRDKIVHPDGPVEEVRVGDVVTLPGGDGGVTVRAVYAHHDSRRLPGSRYRAQALGFVIEHAGTRVYFAGDTGMCPQLADIGPVDIALLPVGGWGPTLGEGHLDPEQAADVARLVGARRVVPIHYGTFWPVGLRTLSPATYRRMFLEPGERFARAVDAHGLEIDVHVIRPGQELALDGHRG